MNTASDRPRRVELAACTERGLVREDNQDVLLIDGWACCAPTSSLQRQISLQRDVTCAVIDGMGGHHGGAVAAWLVAHHLARGAAGVEDAGSADDFAQSGHDFVSDAGNGLGTPAMGAAFAVLNLNSGGFAVANVGDCRVYRATAEAFVLLTVDDVGPSRLDPAHQVLTQSIGGGGRVRIDAHWFSSPWSAARSTRFLLASDGLAVVEIDTVAGLVGAGTPEQAAAELVDAALAAGAPDNVTVVVVDIHAAEEIGDAYG